MNTFKKYIVSLLAVGVVLLSSLSFVTATTITNGSYTFQSLNPAPSGTGAGTYDVRLFQNSSGGAGNDGGGVDVDDSNGNLPTGDPNTDSGSLFWITSIGDLRAYYDLQFGANKVNNIVLFLDIDETGGVQDLNVVTLDIYKNATTTPTALNPTGANDLSQGDQQGTTGRTGGTLLTQLGTSPQTLLQFNTGAGSDDWAIFTGINPYDAAFGVNDTLLFNFRINILNNGPELLSISGDVSNCDFPGQECPGPATTATQVPEPSTILLLGSGLFALAKGARRKRN